MKIDVITCSFEFFHENSHFDTSNWLTISFQQNFEKCSWLSFLNRHFAIFRAFQQRAISLIVEIDAKNAFFSIFYILFSPMAQSERKIKCKNSNTYKKAL